MTRAFRSIAGAGVGVVNATGDGLAGTVKLSVARVGVELISACFCDVLHPAISRGKITTNARKRQHILVGIKVRISRLKKISKSNTLSKCRPLNRSCAELGSAPGPYRRTAAFSRICTRTAPGPSKRGALEVSWSHLVTAFPTVSAEDVTGVVIYYLIFSAAKGLAVVIGYSAHQTSSWRPLDLPTRLYFICWAKTSRNRATGLSSRIFVPSGSSHSNRHK
jgi:hypothetical protein